jgi:hypothetical protein
MVDDSPMTKSERDQLSKLLEARARAANRVVEQRAAELEADVEAKLAATFEMYDPKWKDLTAAADRVVRDADAEIAARCRALGIPEAFRPGLSLWLSGRGEKRGGDATGRASRYSRIDALAKAARHAIESQALDRVTKLALGTLASTEAKAFLASMPTVEA